LALGGGSWCCLADCLRREGCIPSLGAVSPEFSGGGERRMRIFYKRVPVVRKAHYTAGGLCGSVCPHACLEVLGGSGALVQPDACTSEDDCVSVCHVSAIRVSWVPSEWRPIHRTMASTRFDTAASPTRVQPKPQAPETEPGLARRVEAGDLPQPLAQCHRDFLNAARKGSVTVTRPQPAANRENKGLRIARACDGRGDGVVYLEFGSGAK